MNNVRWTVTFKTIKERTAVVSIADADYNVEPQAIEPAIDAVTIDAISQSLTDSVRTSTGYLRIIDNNDLDGILPIGILDRPVELHIDGHLYWRGYITPATYTAGWEVAPSEQAFPIQSAITTLSDIVIPEQGEVFATIAGLLLELLSATGYTWQGIYIPIQMTGIDHQSVAVPELRMRVCRYNWLAASSTDPEDADYSLLEGRTYMEMLQDICQYFGWQAVEYADSIVMLSNRYDVTNYIMLSMAELTELANNDSATITADVMVITIHSEDSLQWDGLNHTYSIVPGNRKVVVTANSNITDLIVPHLTFSGRSKFVDTHIVAAGVNTHNVVLAIPSDMHFYQWANGKEVPYRYPDTRKDMEASTAYLVFNDTFATTTNYYYKEYLRIRLDGAYRILKVADITSHSAGIYQAGSALCLSLNINSSYVKYDGVFTDIDDIGLSAWGPGNCYLNLSIGVGNSWWNGSTWIDVPEGEQLPIVNIYAGVEEGTYDWVTAPQATGRLANTKTIDDPYPGADGYLMKVDRLLTGKTKIIFYHYNYSDTFQPPTPRAIYLSNISLQYYSGLDNNKSGQLRFSALTGYAGRGYLNIALSMSSKRQSKAGQGTVYYDGVAISDDNIPTYADGITELPEQHLLGGLTRMVSASTRKMELEVELDDFFPNDRITLDRRIYIINGIKSNIHDESATLIISSYGQD